ncbi:undecaprenyl pyrophosphate synthase [Spiroplasma sabaudiense Ar-1343]|uniref:Isoprenyl transferase n=1 Tax=Spiroplasma sabaudiense Ar-1343 TaxID=1276257 RepID=W6AJS7_9MOLU|nr:isoprenyl transferase [Spiroplasma sabaudiense]AHI53984.1 undecaprenyl pyrophosphate synthase [Spiroplasma sabaudiense Ar-1343]
MKKPLKHLAIILDGNGRWAKQLGKNRSFGHQKGMEKIEDIALGASQLGIKYLTVFAFSTENWNRPEEEVDFLMQVPDKIFSQNRLDFFQENNIKINWIGRKAKVPTQTKEALDQAISKTANNTGLVLSIAFDYGAWEEITNAVKKITNYIKINKVTNLDVTEELIRENLYTHNLPDVDLLIRTGGQTRISNFLLLQCCYAEIYFSKKMWPDFSQKDLKTAITYYNSVNRRFGGISNDQAE